MIEFAIIGAPKAGTSSLFAWLDAHPSLQGSSPKETYFFMDASHPLAMRQQRKGEPTVHTAPISGFDQFFDESNPGLRFEGTTHYYYQETAREIFSQLDPKPHVFFVLRQPAFRIRSSFLFTKHNRGLVDYELTFDRYVDLLMDGKHSELDSYYHSDSSLYIAKRELDLSHYVIWLKRWEGCLGADRVHPIIFEKFVENNRREVMKICKILKIDPSFYEEYSVSPKNETTLVRSPRLQRFAFKVGTRVPDFWLKRIVKSLYQTVQMRNSISHDTASTKHGVERLKNYFSPWNVRLVKHSELELSTWD
jgi:hypothetical protein